MQKTKQVIPIILAVVLIVAYFLPWVSLFFNFTAWDVVFGRFGKLLPDPIKYLSVLIPLSSLLIIYGAALNKENYLLPKGILFLLPILSLTIISVNLSVTHTKKHGNFDMGNIFQIFGIGLWLTVVGSIILLFFIKKGKSRF